MKYTKDDYRSMMDAVGIKLKDEDSSFAMTKLVVANSLAYQWKKFSSDNMNELYVCANSAISERRRKLDHEITLMLQQRYLLAPGNLRERFDECWAKCLEESLSQNVSNKINYNPMRPSSILGMMLISTLYSPELVYIVRQAWQSYLKEGISIIDAAWKEAGRE